MRRFKFYMWVKKNYYRQKHLAEILGISQVRLSRLINGQATPTDSEIGIIENLSAGKITEKDFV